MKLKICAVGVAVGSLVVGTEALRPLGPRWTPQEDGYIFVPQNFAENSKTLSRRDSEEPPPPPLGYQGVREMAGLRPVKRKLASTAGHHKRSLDDLDALYPSDVDTFFWAEDPSFTHTGTISTLGVGNHDGGGRRRRADDKGFVDLDLIEDMLLPEGVLCHGKNDLVQLVFRERRQLDDAVEAWRFVNEAKDNHFYLMISPPHCKSLVGDDRMPFRVDHVESIAKQGVIVLKGRIAEWGESLPQWSVMAAQTTEGVRRGTYEEEVERSNRAGSDGYCDWVLGAYNIVDMVIDWVPLPKQLKTKWGSHLSKLWGCMAYDVSSWTVNLGNVIPATTGVRKALPFGAAASASFPKGGMSGEIVIDIHVKGSGYQIDTGNIKIRPNNVRFGGKFGLQAGATIFKGVTDPVTHGLLFQQTVPLGGFFIKGLFAVGPTIVIRAVYNLLHITGGGSVNVDGGIVIPNDAYLDFHLNEEKTKWVNRGPLEKWENLVQKTADFSASLDINVDSSIATTANIGVSASVFTDTPKALSISAGVTIVPFKMDLMLGLQRSFTCDACGLYDWGFSGNLATSGAIDLSASIDLDGLGLSFWISKRLKQLYYKTLWSGCKGFFDPNTKCEANKNRVEAAKAMGDMDPIPLFGYMGVDQILNETEAITLAEINEHNQRKRSIGPAVNGRDWF